MKVSVGADHAGFVLKGEIVSWLESEGHQVNDLGAHDMDPDDDYPDFAVAVAGSVSRGEAERGIVVCGSAVGALTSVCSKLRRKLVVLAMQIFDSLHRGELVLIPVHYLTLDP